MESLEEKLALATFLVSSSDDSGPGSFRQAILDANAAAGADQIEFNIPSGLLTILPDSPLPKITQPVTIDGTTQPGFVDAPIVEINGANAGTLTTGLVLAGGQSTVRGLIITEFDADGIRIEGPGSNVIAGNYIGFSGDVQDDVGNDLAGVFIDNSASNMIGGTSSADRNVISGNQRNGIFVFGSGATDNRIEGNLIGTDDSGQVAKGNGLNGIVLDDASDNTIGGVTAAHRNVISANALNGITIAGGAATGNVVQGNYIGLDITGTQDLGNALDGVLLTSPANRPDGPATNNFIGGTEVGARNVISGNGQYGIEIFTGANGQVIQQNYVGLSADGESAIGNGIAGMGIFDASANQIGGTDANARNVVSGNLGAGIQIEGSSSTVNHVLGNFIGTNWKGDSSVPNEEGIKIDGAVNNIVGSPIVGGRNVISGNQLAGVAITGSGATQNQVAGNFIGVAVDGLTQLRNVGPGVRILDGPKNLIGGDDSTLANVISGNALGVQVLGLEAVENRIVGNLIGTGVNGTTAVPNELGGVTIENAPNNEIGGPTEIPGTAPGNLISGNRGHGVLVFGAMATGSIVAGNLIGTDVTGKLAVANEGPGVHLDSSPQSLVGGLTLDVMGVTVTSRNVVAGNSGAGVLVAGMPATRNTVEGNYIGTDIDGNTALGNSQSGVLIDNAPGNLIGGTGSLSRNLISGNAEGLTIRGTEAKNNRIEGNFIGTDRTGTMSVGNVVSGVRIDGAADNTIGANTAAPGDAPGNLIAGNQQYGVQIRGAAASGNTLAGNLIGTDVSGAAALSNRTGVLVADAATNTIGGISSTSRNIVSGNLFGVVLEGTGTTANVVQGNWIGLSADGSMAVGNSDGVSITQGATGNRIGGTLAGEDNVISGNARAGIRISDTGTTNNTVQGNAIGTNPARAAAIANGDGVQIVSGASNNTIGGVDVDEGNLISGNTTAGVSLLDTGTTGNLIRANLIGTADDRTTLLGNGHHGVFVREASGNTIGGLDADDGATNGNVEAGNVIAGNGATLARKGHGVLIESGNRNRIIGNSIHSNSGRGIDLGNDGFTPNDPGKLGVDPDVDMGANDLQNYPVVRFVQFDFSASPMTTTIFASLHTTPNTTVSIEAFSNTQLDPSGFGEGESFVGAATYTTDANGIVVFPFTVDLSSTFISMTATDSDGNTSEFSMIDTDADAIADAWETKGMGMDINEDGVVELDLFDKGAQPDHKDVLVEIDAMAGFAPPDPVLDWVKNGRFPISDGFANAPLEDVQNPDGTKGVNLIWEKDEISITPVAWTGDLDGDGLDALGEDQNANGLLDPGEDINGNGQLDPGDPDDQDGFPFLEALKANPLPNPTSFEMGGFGTSDERRSTEIIQAKRLVYRYAFFADHFASVSSAGGSTTHFSGIAETGGNDLIVSLGTWSTPGGTPFEQAGTFMHELGHILNLRHGGGDDTNLKPNYYSVMNYTWQTPDPGFSAGWRLDYSRDRLDPLDESSLDESAGLGGDKSIMTPIGPIRDKAGNFIGPTLVPQGDSWDFSGDDKDMNGTADDDKGIPRDINFLRGTKASPGESLEGHDDWSNLRFYFRDSAAFESGVHTGAAEEMDLDTDIVLATAGIGPGLLLFKHETRELGESSGDVTVTVIRSAGLEGTVTVDYAVTGGTATAGADFTDTSGTLTFAENEFIKTFSLSLVDDALAENGESIVLTLSNVTGGAALGDIPQTTLQILDDDGPGVIQFEHAFNSVREDAGQAKIKLSRKQGTSGDVTVQFATTTGTASPGADYQPVIETVMFADGESEKTVMVPIIADRTAESLEGILLELTQATNGASVGPLSYSVLTIQDVEPTEFQFDMGAYSADEASGQVTVTVERSGNLDRQVSVDLDSVGFTAGAGTDYEHVDQTLNFDVGESTKNITIPITNDALGEPTEIFALHLSSPSAGTFLGSTDSADVSIIDDEAAVANFLTVTSTNDSGPGSLREAILAANSQPGLDYVTFDIPGAGPHTIQPLSSLPPITDPITIDGYTQPGAQPNTISDGSDAILLIEVDGSNVSFGFRLDNVADSMIRGLVVNGFQSFAVAIVGPAGGGNVIEGNYVGTDVTGMQDRGNTFAVGISIGNSLDNQVGGVATGTRNVVSGSRTGIIVQGATIATTGNQIQGNYVGVAADGVTPMGNDREGIRVLGKAGTSILIGGTIPGAGNVVAYNQFRGIEARSEVIFPTILGNSVFNNAFTGIDRGSRPNDPADSIQQNYPILGSAVSVNGVTEVQGYLQTRPNETFRIEFFANSTIEPTGFGEGKTFLGAVDAMSDATGLAPFLADLAVDLPPGTNITATATGVILGTSGFSARLVVGDVLQSVNVVNTNDDVDDGVCDQQHCSLREAIHESNNHPGPNEIQFALDATAATIVPTLQLPRITEAVTIDGTSQPGFNGTPIVEISHANTGVIGLEILGGGSTIRGLVFNGRAAINLGVGNVGTIPFRNNINAAAGDNRIVGNFLGTDPTGTMASGGANIIVYSSGNVIGGTSLLDRNLISGDQPFLSVGIVLNGSDNEVIGNFIGTDITGTQAISSNRVGISLEGQNNRVGGTGPGAGNVISGNPNGGIFVARAVNATIQGNLIGTDFTGTVPLGNGGRGIRVGGGSVDQSLLIGGAQAGAGNVIAASDESGILIDHRSRFDLDVSIQGNFIGTDSQGTLDLGNGLYGIRVNPFVNPFTVSGLSLRIGGNDPNEGNLIAYNGASGIVVESPASSTPTPILNNRIYANDGLGIDLADDGVTFNDPGDADVGPNGLANFPDLASANADGGLLTVDGSLSALPSTVYRLEFFLNGSADPTGFGEGEIPIGNLDITTDSSGVASFTADLVVDADAGQFVTSTATDGAGNTSEFSQAAEVTAVSQNTAPSVAADHDSVTVDEGDTATNTGTFSDPDLDIVTLSASIGTISQSGSHSGTWSWSYPTNDGPDDSQSVVITATDSEGAFSTTSFQLNILNLAPMVGAIEVTPDPAVIPIGDINASASFTDAGTNDTHDATWDWGDGTTSACATNSVDCTLDQLTNRVTGSHAYTEPGLYTVTLSVRDDDGGTGQSDFQFVVVFDVDAGFVTGGGTIDSPAGAYLPDPTLTGKANFGFVAKYKKKQTNPKGNVTFHFKAGDLKFKSSSFQWLVIAGAEATFNGQGTINGDGNFGFQLNAVDEALTSDSSEDLFGIRIWDKDNGDAVVYDNRSGNPDPATTPPISNGSIVIHKPAPARPAVKELPLAGDSNLDGIFDSRDLVHVFNAGKYETGSADFVEGDWNDDGFFNSSDLVGAFQAGHYQAAQPANRSPHDPGVKSALDQLLDEWGANHGDVRRADDLPLLPLASDVLDNRFPIELSDGSERDRLFANLDVLNLDGDGELDKDVNEESNLP